MKKVISVVLALMLLISISIPAAAISSKSETKGKPVKLSIIQGDAGRILQEGNIALKELEKQANVKLKVYIIPGSEFNTKYGVIVASGNLPDISRLGGFDFQKYAGQGVYKDIEPYLKQAPNLTKSIKQDEWDLVKYKGVQYGIPQINIAGKYICVARKDWMENLGIKAPSTLDEYTEMLKKFTFNDPDKNGKNDTYGMDGEGNWSTTIMPDFDHIFGAFGIIPGQNVLKNNSVYPNNISEEYKAALTYIKSLWDAKVIDPDIFTIKTEAARQRHAQGRSGTFNGWWSIAPQIIVGQLKGKELSPKMDWDVLTIKGKDGKTGYKSNGVIAATNVISAKSKNAEAAVKFLDFLGSDKGFELAYYGIKGMHYTEPGKPRTAAGDAAYAQKWLDPLAQMIGRPDLQFGTWAKNATDPVKIFENGYVDAAKNAHLYVDLFYGLPRTDAQNLLLPDLQKYEVEMLIKFITGATPMSKWDEYVSAWKSKGGKEILESQVEAYNKLRNTKYTSGI